MRPISDVWHWAVKKVGDHPAVVVGSVIGGAVGSVLGPLGSITGAAAGASIGNTLDQSPTPPAAK